MKPFYAEITRQEGAEPESAIVINEHIFPLPDETSPTGLRMTSIFTVAMDDDNSIRHFSPGQVQFVGFVDEVVEEEDDETDPEALPEQESNPVKESSEPAAPPEE